MANNPKTAGEVTQTPKEKIAQKSHVEYYLDNEKFVFPLDKPITTRVMHVYHTGGWVSQKWGPPPNMDGTPSTKGLNSTTTPSNTLAAGSSVPSVATNSAVPSSPSLLPANAVENPANRLPAGLIRSSNSTLSEPVSSTAAVTSNGKLYETSDLASRTGALPSSPSATAGSSNTSPTVLSGIPRPTAPTPSTTISPVDAIPTTKAASVSLGLPSNVVTPANKTYIGPDLLRAPVTASTSSLHRGKSTGKSLRGGIGEDLEVVSKTELDDEFDVLDNEGPSAGNGATKYCTAILSDRDGALTAGWDEDE